jgi:hypothetical protein
MIHVYPNLYENLLQYLTPNWTKISLNSEYRHIVLTAFSFFLHYQTNSKHQIIVLCQNPHW